MRRFVSIKYIEKEDFILNILLCTVRWISWLITDWWEEYKKAKQTWN